MQARVVAPHPDPADADGCEHPPSRGMPSISSGRMGKEGRPVGKKKDRKRLRKLLATAGVQRIAARGTASSGNGSSDGAEAPPSREPATKMSRKEFESALEPLQVELVKLQEWVQQTGAKICVLFEGRDTAGKGGGVKGSTDGGSPSGVGGGARRAPTEGEKSQS